MYRRACFRMLCCFRNGSRRGYATVAQAVRPPKCTYADEPAPTITTPPDLHTHDNDLFSYSRGRFVINEHHEVSQRYVWYDIDELGSIAAKAVGAKSCVGAEKYPDGMYNKTLLLTMDDGVQVVAKIPNPNAGRPDSTTASEVATMEFAREILGTPTPKVLLWCSRAEETGVGAEFIVMEKVPGVQLDSVWPTMEVRDRLTIVKRIAGYQKAWTACSFSQYGSLYYRQDLRGCVPHLSYTDKNGKAVTDPRFAVGPSTARGFNDDGRSSIDLDRGPWNTVEAYASAIGNREIDCVCSISELPKSPLSLRGPGTYQPTRERKLKALHCYLTMLPYLLPTDHTISRSHLWHSDLHVENIFVDPNQPTKIVSIIDWQSTVLAPLFEHAQQPYLLDYEGSPVNGLERPHYPSNLSQLSPAAQRDAKNLYWHKTLSVLYKTLVHKQNPVLYRAMAFQETPGFDFMLLARSLLVDGEATYLAHVAELKDSWDKLPGVCANGGPPFPFHFSQEDIAEFQATNEGWVRGMEAMQEIRNTLGDLFPDKGVVRNDQYDDTKAALRQIKEQVVQEFAKNKEEERIWRETWPFDD